MSSFCKRQVFADLLTERFRERSKHGEQICNINLTPYICLDDIHLVHGDELHCGSKKNGPLLYFQIFSTNTHQYPKFLVHIISYEPPMFMRITNDF